MAGSSAVTYGADPSSCADLGPNKPLLFHAALDLRPCFDSRLLRATARLDFKIPDATKCDTGQLSHLPLDTRGLCVKEVTLVSEPEPRALTFNLGSPLGVTTPLIIDISAVRIVPTADSLAKLSLCIEYETAPSSTTASALQWLAPSQTLGKKHPYLFTQCQAIHARSIMPCQDTPAVKFTYEAKVTVSIPLVPLMSARTLESKPATKSSDGKMCTFYFNQPVAIPSYLLALAVGDIVGAPAGPRTTVYAEPMVAAAAAQEFSAAEEIIACGEKILDMPYKWGTFDILVLPSSFPYGGMENPNMTFATPTLLAGDKSLVNVIIHEFAHSYSGNLVTARTWSHFWLNEGWTVFLERKILSQLNNSCLEAELHAKLGLRELKKSVETLERSNNARFTALCPPLTCEDDPDDAFSSVPYEKGFALLRAIECGVGDEFFAKYAKSYFAEFAGSSIDTEDWKSHLLRYVANNGTLAQKNFIAGIDWNAWLHATGVGLAANNTYDETLANECKREAKTWITAKNTDASLDAWKKFSTTQRVYFLEVLEQCQADSSVLDAVDVAFGLSKSSNCEVRFAWLMLCLKSKYAKIYPAVEGFLAGENSRCQVGRMKYVRPIYRELKACDDAGFKLAVQLFSRLKDGYHSICARLVAKDLDID